MQNDDSPAATVAGRHGHQVTVAANDELRNRAALAGHIGETTRRIDRKGIGLRNADAGRLGLCAVAGDAILPYQGGRIDDVGIATGRIDDDGMGTL